MAICWPTLLLANRRRLRDRRRRSRRRSGGRRLLIGVKRARIFAVVAVVRHRAFWAIKRVSRLDLHLRVMSISRQKLCDSQLWRLANRHASPIAARRRSPRVVAPHVALRATSVDIGHFLSAGRRPTCARRLARTCKREMRKQRASWI